MNATGFVALAVEKNGRNYVLNLPFGSPYEDAIDACLELIKTVKSEAQYLSDSIDIRGILDVKYELNGRSYVLNIAYGSSSSDAIDACLDMISDIKQMKKDSDAQVAAQKP